MVTGWKEREEKGRVGEDIVTLGFRMRGYRVHRVGIEHTESRAGYDVLESIKKDALFTQMRKSPDFLLTKGGEYIYLEVKYRSNPNAWEDPSFIRHLVMRYLGSKKQRLKDAHDDLALAERTGSAYWRMYQNVYLLLLMPDNAKMARLGDFMRTTDVLTPCDSKNPNAFEKKIHSGPKQNWNLAWDSGLPPVLDEDFKWFRDRYFKALQNEAMPDWMSRFRKESFGHPVQIKGAVLRKFRLRRR